MPTHNHVVRCHVTRSTISRSGSKTFGGEVQPRLLLSESTGLLRTASQVAPAQAQAPQFPAVFGGRWEALPARTKLTVASCIAFVISNMVSLLNAVRSALYLPWPLCTGRH